MIAAEISATGCSAHSGPGACRVSWVLVFAFAFVRAHDLFDRVFDVGPGGVGAGAHWRETTFAVEISAAC